MKRGKMEENRCMQEYDDKKNEKHDNEYNMMMRTCDDGDLNSCHANTLTDFKNPVDFIAGSYSL